MTPQFTVLRIKRKATEPPLSSLVIADGGASRAVKRRDVGRGGARRGVFRLADTVPQTWQGQGEEGEVLKTRIQDLLAGSSASSTANDTAASTAPPVATPSTDTIAAGASAAAGQGAGPSAAPAPSARPATQTQYRVIPPVSPFRQDPNLPPRVITLAELEAARSALHFVDAQAVATDEPQDAEMAAFQSMLSEYLKLEAGAERAPLVKKDEEDEYVYDLYYRDVNGDAGDGEGIGALLGYEDLSPPSTPPDSEPEDEADEDSNDEDYYRNDYPEDEDADEDMEGFEDAYSDGEWSRDEDEYADERDPWEDYR